MRALDAVREAIESYSTDPYKTLIHIGTIVNRACRHGNVGDCAYCKECDDNDTQEG